jgi:5-carboxymethyl-2-hydroxymuconate isomerase
MPHLIVEHSADAASTAGLGALCDALFAALAAHPSITKPETLKLRTYAAGAHLLGTRGQSFAHATLRLLPGRDAGTRSDLAQVILGVLEVQMPQVHSLSVDISDLDPAYAKRVLPN